MCLRGEILVRHNSLFLLNDVKYIVIGKLIMIMTLLALQTHAHYGAVTSKAKNIVSQCKWTICGISSSNLSVS